MVLATALHQARNDAPTQVIILHEMYPDYRERMEVIAMWARYHAQWDNHEPWTHLELTPL